MAKNELKKCEMYSIYGASVCNHGNAFRMNEKKIVPDFKRNTFLIQIPKFTFYQNLRPKTGLKLSRPL